MCPNGSIGSSPARLPDPSPGISNRSNHLGAIALALVAVLMLEPMGWLLAASS